MSDSKKVTVYCMYRRSHDACEPFYHCYDLKRPHHIVRYADNTITRVSKMQVSCDSLAYEEAVKRAETLTLNTPWRKQMERKLKKQLKKQILILKDAVTFKISEQAVLDLHPTIVYTCASELYAKYKKKFINDDDDSGFEFHLNILQDLLKQYDGNLDMRLQYLWESHF